MQHLFRAREDYSSLVLTETNVVFQSAEVAERYVPEDQPELAVVVLNEGTVVGEKGAHVLGADPVPRGEDSFSLRAEVRVRPHVGIAVDPLATLDGVFDRNFPTSGFFRVWMVS